MTRNVLRSAACLTGATGLLGAGLVFAGAASASPDPTCVAVRDSTAITCTYLFTGAERSFVVPDGVTTIDVVVTGAAGGRTLSPPATAPAASVSGSLTVQPASTLVITVGGVGGDAMQSSLDAPMPGGLAGFNGGAAGGASVPAAGRASTSGAGGGGASDIRLIGAPSAGSLESRLVVAAGSGGGSTESAGPGDPTDWNYAAVDQPAADDGRTEDVAGDVDANTVPVPDWAQWRLDGRFGTATAGQAGAEAGGGGGGGVFGGAGGAAALSGQGGTSLVPAGGRGTVSTEPASVVVTYEEPEAATEAPAPTETPVPTETAGPSESPVPTETAVPSESPVPTETAVPSETVAPSETAVPVAAAVAPESAAATETIAPAETPAPTETPAPVAAPDRVETPAPVEMAAEPTAPVVATATADADVEVRVQTDGSASPLPTSLLDANGAGVLAAGVLGGLVVALGTALAVAVRRRP